MGIFDAAASVFNTAIGSISANRQLKKEQKYNAAEAQKNRDFQREERLATQEFDLDMWNKTNEYNSLASQIVRAKEAGVSPTAVIGDGSNSGFAKTIQSSPSSGSPTAPSPSIAGQMSLLPQQQRLLDAQAAKTEKEAEGQGISNDWNTATFEDRIAALKQDLANKTKEGREIDERINTLVADRDIKYKLFENLARKTDQEIAESKQRVLNLENQYKTISKEREVMDAEIDYKESLTEGQSLDNSYQSLKNEVSKEIGYPIDSPEFNQAWHLFKQGKLSELDDLLVQRARMTLHDSSTWAAAAGLGTTVGSGIDKAISDAERSFRKSVDSVMKSIKNMASEGVFNQARSRR